MKEHAHARRASAHRKTPKTDPLFKQGVFSTLMPELQKAVAGEGYDTPTPVQEQCIEHLLGGRDLVGSAQTGTGKTAAFALPLLQKLSRHGQRPRKGTPRALILASTRELAAQIGDSIRTYGRYLRLSQTVIFGGVNQIHQVKVLNRGVDILVATPGRLLDLIGQGFIHLGEIEVFILDEGDRMLDMGFMPDIRRIVSLIPEKRQTLFFSATMPPKIEALARTMVHDPVRVSIAPDKPAVERIDQKVLFVGKKDKDALLIDLLRNSRIDKAIIFTQMKHAANRLMGRLHKAGVRVEAIHGNKSQSQRTRALDGFRQNRFRVLVATDVAARGLDVDDITHVINYDLPVEAETYVHRIGRTARAGADGSAISFCCAEDRYNLREIERLLGRQVPTEMKHAYHCDQALNSTQSAPKSYGGNGGRRRHSRPSKGSFSLYRGRKRRRSS